ncbi:MAG: GatB/YqeY domain-containing protein [Candidatus Nealsonbacteria bacterium]
MALRQEIQGDLNESVKGKEELRSSVLRLLLAAMLNKEKEKRYKSGEAKDVPLTDEEIIDVILSEVKKRKEAAELYKKGDRNELAEKEKKEAEILQKYLPEQMSEDELIKLVKSAIAKVGAKTQKDMGRVMAGLMPQVKGKADGGLISKVVKESLTGQK